MQRGTSRSMQMESLKSIVHTLQENESLGPAMLAFFCALALFLVIPFYGEVVSVALASALGAVAYFRPRIGIAITVILGAFPIAHHFPSLAWLYSLFFLGIYVFELRFRASIFDWRLIAYMLLLVSASLLPVQFIGLAAFIVFAIGCLALGSERAIVFAVFSVYLILLASSLWNVQNAMYLPFGNQEDFKPFEKKLNLVSFEPIEPVAIPAKMLSAAGAMFSWDGIASTFVALAKCVANTISLLGSGTLFVNGAIFAICAYAIGHLPIRIKDNKFAQTISTLPIIACAGAIAFMASALGEAISPLPFVYSFGAVFAIAMLDMGNVKISREAEILASDSYSKFGKFGEQRAEVPNVRLKDIGGYEDVKAELMDALAAPLQNKTLAGAYDLKPSSGILLFGPPGTGKTLLMRALAAELGMNFKEISCTDILSSWHGESEANVKEVFEKARVQAPCLLFFDELEALAKSRDKSFNDDVGPRVLTVLLQQMDGFSKHAHSKPVIVVGATNLPNNLDPAIMRPGRLDKIIYMHLPDFDARERILRVHTSKLPLDADVDLRAIAKISEGYSGADLANIVREASRLAAREARSKNSIVPITQKHFIHVLKSVRPSTSAHQLAMYDRFRDEFERSVR